MAVKCIALDLDRTTLNGQGKLSKGNREALEYAIQKGIHVVIASGRSFHTLPKDVMEVPGIQYAITSNGTAIYHIPTKKCIHQYKLDGESTKLILQLSKSEDVTYEAFIEGKAYADRTYINNPRKFGAGEEAVEYVKNTRNMVENIEAFMLEHIDELDCMDIIIADDEKQQRVMDEIKEKVKGVYITSCIDYLIEISNEKGGKHSGLKYMMELLGLKREEVAAFGDAENDMDMLKFAGIGIAMENACESCKEIADFVTKHHDEDGVAYGIYEILKI